MGECAYRQTQVDTTAWRTLVTGVGAATAGEAGGEYTSALGVTVGGVPGGLGDVRALGVPRRGAGTLRSRRTGSGRLRASSTRAR
jgi:hypothetical protein